MPRPRLSHSSRLRSMATAVLLTFPGALLFDVDASADPLFDAPFYGSDVGLFPKATAVADFNGDGNPDLVVANIRETVSVLLGRGDGTFAPKRDAEAGPFPSSVAAADLNGDQSQDIVVAGSDALYVLLGNGDGSFQGKNAFGAGTAVYTVAIGDLNTDGKIDVVAAGAGGVMVLLGAGDGSLGPATLYGGNLYAVGLSVADATHDGFLDAIAVNYFAGSISVLPGAGDGTLASGQTYDVGDYPQTASVGDLNGDDLPDIVVSNSGSNSISVLLGRPDGSLASLPDLATESWSHSVSLGDLNGDSRLDLVTTGGTYSHAEIFLGAGDATFERFREFPTCVGPNGQVLADLNLDGRLDLTVVDGNHIVVSHLGNGDGTFGAVAPLAVGGIDVSALALGDLNGDGSPDLVVGGGLGSAQAAVFLGRGDGNFGPAMPFDPGNFSISMALGDVNGDRRLDLVLGALSSVAVSLGDGAGTFAAKAILPTGHFARAVKLSDLDRDGHLDIACVDDSLVWVFIGTGDGTFETSRHYSTREHPVDVTVNDFNGDGHPDLAVCEGGPYSLAGPTSVGVLLGVGDGSFAGPQEFFIPGDCTGIASGDFDGDGAFDLAMSDGSYNALTARAVWVALGNGDGSFAELAGFGDGGYSQRVEIADLNGDGRLDIVTGTSRTVYVLTGRGDGSFEAAGHFGSSGYIDMAIGDVNLDGRLDIAAPVDDFEEILGINILLNRGGTPGGLPARILVREGERVVPVGVGGPHMCVHIEAVGGSFDPGAIDLGTIEMSFTDDDGQRSIHSTLGKHAVLADIDRNGVPDLQACFSSEDLGRLLANVRGKRTVTLSLKGTLTTGARFVGTFDLDVVGTGRKPGFASVSPNPLNPEGVLTFYTSKTSAVKVALFDPGGRLVKTLLDVTALPAGAHTVRIDGRGGRGESLASGVYFFRIEGAEKVTTGRLTILK